MKNYVKQKLALILMMVLLMTACNSDPDSYKTTPVAATPNTNEITTEITSEITAEVSSEITSLASSEIVHSEAQTFMMIEPIYIGSILIFGGGKVPAYVVGYRQNIEGGEVQGLLKIINDTEYSVDFENKLPANCDFITDLDQKISVSFETGLISLPPEAYTYRISNIPGSLNGSPTFIQYAKEAVAIKTLGESTIEKVSYDPSQKTLDIGLDITAEVIQHLQKVRLADEAEKIESVLIDKVEFNEDGGKLQITFVTSKYMDNSPIYFMEFLIITDQIEGVPVFETKVIASTMDNQQIVPKTPYTIEISFKPFFIKSNRIALVLRQSQYTASTYTPAFYVVEDK